MPIYSRGKPGEIKDSDIKNRFLDVEMFTSNPMTEKLSGLKVEYAIALIHSSQAGKDKDGKPAVGKREATIFFDVGQGTQDLGFRAETAVLFDIRVFHPFHDPVLVHAVVDAGERVDERLPQFLGGRVHVLPEVGLSIPLKARAEL